MALYMVDDKILRSSRRVVRRRLLICLYLAVAAGVAIARGFYDAAQTTRPIWMDALDGLLVVVAFTVILVIFIRRKHRH